MSNGEELSLLPCPFCGGTAEWYDITEADEVGNAGGSCIICTKCQACGPVQFGEKDTIVDQWNRRSSPSAVEAAEVVPWACLKCNSPRSIDPCPKCGTALTKPADGWDWPTLPDIDRIRALAKEVGYAVGVHGSLERDLDLIAAPWVADAVEPMALAEHIAAGLGGRVVDYERQDKPCGRWSCNIHTPDWTKMIDLSVMPPMQPGDFDADAARDVLAERQRQVTAEGWTPEHDDQHVEFEMASAAGVYALAAGTKDRRFIERGSYSNDYFEAALKLWPWDRSWWKPKDRRRDLVKAGALILAEIERLDRARNLLAGGNSNE